MFPKLGPDSEPTDLSISEWNRHVDVAEHYDRTMARGQIRPRLGSTRDTNLVQVSNNSGADRREGEILEFTGFALTDLDGDVPLLWFTGGEPSLDNGFGVLLRPMPNDSSVMDVCQIAGACKALVNVTDAGHKFATVEAGEYVLQSAASGPIRILSNPAGGTGEKTCAVLLGSESVAIHRGITDEDLDKGTTATVSRYNPGTTTDSTIDDEVTNELADVGTGKVVYYFEQGGNKYVFAAECPLT
jgi:hypothetical protein